MPTAVMLKTEILQAVTRLCRVGHHLRRPGTEVLNATDFDAGIVNINPIVIKHVSLFQDEHDGEEIAILKTFRRAPRPLRNLWRKPANQLTHGRRGNDVIRSETLQITLPIFELEAPCRWQLVVSAPGDFAAHLDATTAGFYLLGACFPHHAGPTARIPE